MSDGCKHVKDILSVEIDLIKDHISKHQWCNRFDTEQEAIVDFVHKYAWIMREVFCGVMCKYRDVCDCSDQFKKAFLDDISDGEIEKYIKLNYHDTNKDVIKIKLQVLKNDITVHKWLNKIDNYEDAVKDFLNRFGWIIYDMYRRTKAKYEGR